MKRFLSLLLMVTMIFSLVGCGEKTPETGYFTVLSNNLTHEFGDISGSYEISVEKKGIVYVVELVKFLMENKENKITNFKFEENDETKEMEKVLDEALGKIGNPKLAVTYSGQVAKDKSTDLNLKFQLGDFKVFDGNIVLKDNKLYLSSETIKNLCSDIIPTLNEKLELGIDEELKMITDSIEELIKKYDYILLFEMTEEIKAQLEEGLEGMSKEAEENGEMNIGEILKDLKEVENYKEYIPSLTLLLQDIDDLINTYGKDFVRAENNKYSFILDVNTFKQNLSNSYTLAKKQPKKFYDKISKLALDYADSNLVQKIFENDEEEIKKLQELKTKLTDKNNKKEFAKKYKDKDFETFYNETFKDLSSDILNFFRNSSIVSTIDNTNGTFTSNVKISISLDGNLILNINSISSITPKDLATIDKKDFEKSIGVEEFYEEVETAIMGNYYDFEEYEDEEFEFDEDFEDEEFYEEEIIDDEDEFVYGDLVIGNDYNTGFIPSLLEFAENKFDYSKESIVSKYETTFNFLASKHRYSMDEFAEYTTSMDDYKGGYFFAQKNNFKTNLTLSFTKTSAEAEIFTTFNTSDFEKEIKDLKNEIKTFLGIELTEENIELLRAEATDGLQTEKYISLEAEKGDLQYSLGYGEYSEGECSISIAANIYDF